MDKIVDVFFLLIKWLGFCYIFFYRVELNFKILIYFRIILKLVMLYFKD